MVLKLGVTWIADSRPHPWPPDWRAWPFQRDANVPTSAACARRLPAEAASDDTNERQVPEFMTDLIDRYIGIHRPVLCDADIEHQALWVSSTTGCQLTTKNLGTLISKLTRETVSIDVSPHLFRTAVASTAAIYGGNNPHLASALLGHRDARALLTKTTIAPRA